MALPSLTTFGEAYFYLFDFESNIEFDEELEHLVGVSEGRRPFKCHKCWATNF
jgi:hypothetical protein